MTDLHSAAMVGVMALVTAFLRFLPFGLFRGRKIPKFITYLSTVLPFAIMGMLVVYCLRHISFASVPFGIPELAACALVIAVHIRKRKTLLSIISGTVFYMVLVQMVF